MSHLTVGTLTRVGAEFFPTRAPVLTGLAETLDDPALTDDPDVPRHTATRVVPARAAVLTHAACRTLRVSRPSEHPALAVGPFVSGQADLLSSRPVTRVVSVARVVRFTRLDTWRSDRQWRRYDFRGCYDNSRGGFDDFSCYDVNRDIAVMSSVTWYTDVNK